MLNFEYLKPLSYHISDAATQQNKENIENAANLVRNTVCTASKDQSCRNAL
jgi:hypothetical protein